MKRFFIHTIVAFLIACCLAAPVYVQKAVAESGQAFSISPPLINLGANPGQTVTTNIKFTNISGGDLLIKTQYNDFGAKNETGEPNIIFDDNTNTPYSLRQWITGPEPFILKSKEERALQFSITVPKNAEPGGHYAVIRFTGSSPQTGGSGVALSASLGSLVLLQVSGDVTQQATVDSFFAAGQNFSPSSFFENGPINFVERIQNTGNTHIQPSGTIKISNLFGKEVASLRVNGDPSDLANTPRNILPASIRRFNQNYPPIWLFGRYTAQLQLSYAGGKTLVATTAFWVIPYKLILAVFIGAVLVFVGLRLAIKRYNAYIIRQARKKGN